MKLEQIQLPQSCKDVYGLLAFLADPAKTEIKLNEMKAYVDQINKLHEKLGIQKDIEAEQAKAHALVVEAEAARTKVYADQATLKGKLADVKVAMQEAQDSVKGAHRRASSHEKAAVKATEALRRERDVVAGLLADVETEKKALLDEKEAYRDKMAELKALAAA